MITTNDSQHHATTTKATITYSTKIKLIQHIGVCLILLASFLLISTPNQQQVQAIDPLGGIGNLLGGVSHAVSDITGGALANSAAVLNGAASSAQSGGLGGIVPNVFSSASNVVNGFTKPVFGILGSIPGLNGAGNLVGDALRMTTGAISGGFNGGGSSTSSSSSGSGSSAATTATTSTTTTTSTAAAAAPAPAAAAPAASAAAAAPASG